MTELNQQIQQIEAMALQHFPNDEQARNAYKVELLLQRLKEIHFAYAREKSL